MEKQQLKMVLEGITVNHVGELVFDTQKTSNERKKFRYTYLICLEDVAQEFIFADKVIVSKKMSDVAKTSPETGRAATYYTAYH